MSMKMNIMTMKIFKLSREDRVARDILKTYKKYIVLTIYFYKFILLLFLYYTTV